MNAEKGEVEIRLFPSEAETAKSYDAQDEGRVIEAIRTQVLPQAGADYHSVRVKVKRSAEYAPDYLVAYMLRKDTYTADVVKIQIDGNYDVLGIEEDYDDSADFEEEEEDEEAEQYAPGWGALDFVAATPVPEIPTAKSAVMKLHATALQAGLRSKVLLGKDATVANYRKYLTSGLKGFVNIGHGYTGGIVLWDGNLTSGWLRTQWGRTLIPAIVYFNSCKVFNNPLKPAVTYAGARTYVGGIVNLLIGPSEDVCKGFWNETMLDKRTMYASLKRSEKAHYPSTGAHGITGDRGTFDMGRMVALRACNGRYVCAEGGGSRELIANRDWIRSWETFRLVDYGGRRVGLQVANGNYVCAEGGGGHDLVANRPWLRKWEEFRLIRRGDNKVALRASNGQYVCAEDAGDKPLAANRGWIRRWETFELVEQDWARR